MEDILAEAKDLLTKWEEKAPVKIQNWEERQATLNQSWNDSRAELFEAVLKTQFAVAQAQQCSRCAQRQAVVRCCECHLNCHLCGKCDQEIHQFLPLHDRDAIINGHFRPIPPSVSAGSDGEWETIGKFIHSGE